MFAIHWFAVAGAFAQTFQTTGISPGMTIAEVTSLSWDGRVAAGSSRRHQQPPASTAFSWSSNVGRFDFGDEVGTPLNSYATGVSGDGTTFVGRGGAQWFRSFRYRGPGTYEDLGTFGNFTTSTATGVSHDGSVIVGYGGFGYPGYGQAYRWTSQTGMQGIGYTRPGAFYSLATDVSADGRVIVGHSSGPAGVDAFVWRPDTGMQILTPLPGGNESYAYAVSGDGSVVVGASGDGTQGVIWRDGLPMLLPTPIAERFHPIAVDNSGNVVVGSIGITNLIWTPGRGTEQLESYLQSFGVQFPIGWNMYTCYSVSGDGLTFAGSGAVAGSSAQGFVITIPSPASMLVFCIAGSVASRRRRRHP